MSARVYIHVPAAPGRGPQAPLERGGKDAQARPRAAIQVANDTRRHIRKTQDIGLRVTQEAECRSRLLPLPLPLSLLLRYCCRLARGTLRRQVSTPYGRYRNRPVGHKERREGKAEKKKKAGVAGNKKTRRGGVLAPPITLAANGPRFFFL